MEKYWQASAKFEIFRQKFAQNRDFAGIAITISNHGIECRRKVAGF
jgi:hypothetical protein